MYTKYTRTKHTLERISFVLFMGSVRYNACFVGMFLEEATSYNVILLLLCYGFDMPRLLRLAGLAVYLGQTGCIFRAEFGLLCFQNVPSFSRCNNERSASGGSENQLLYLVLPLI